MVNWNRTPQAGHMRQQGGRQAQVEVTEKTLENALAHKNHVVLTYKIVYPQFSSAFFVRVIKQINMFYELQARKYALHCEKKLFKMAVEQFEYSMRNKLPIQKFEAVDVFALTYNRNCALSLYQDRYEYTGGAHGNTVRRSETWSLQRGGQSNLMNFFPYIRTPKEYVVAEIIRQAEKRIESGEEDFFDDYEENIKTHFDASQFYLTENGIELYYQLYELMPYVAGIPTFLIPYAKGAATQPVC